METSHNSVPVLSITSNDHVKHLQPHIWMVLMMIILTHCSNYKTSLKTKFLEEFITNIYVLNFKSA